MYSVYINYYQSGQEISDTETLMFSVPTSSGFPVSKPIVKAGEDYADNFSFTMDSNSPYYSSLLPLKTTIRVEYDGDIIFDGRVLMVNTQSVYHTKSVTCEGYLAYLKDTLYEGQQEKHRSNITVSEYYQKIIDNHNTNAPTKTIAIGSIGVTLPTEKEKYEPSAWSQSSSLVSNLTSNYGGHMKVRNQNGEHYLDWYKYYSRDLGDGNRPQVTIGKNILDISSDQSIDGIFTRLIPIGGTDSSGKSIYIDGYNYTDKNGQQHTHSGKVFPISLIRDLYTDEQLTDEFHSWEDYRDAESKYGTLYKTMQFSDANNQEKLWDMTKKWVKECYFGLVTSFTVKAIDMYIQNPYSPKILIGECVDVNYLIMKDGTPTWETRKLVCKNIQYDLFNPENNSYTFGIPSDMLEHNKERTKSAGKAASASVGKKVVPKGDEDNEITWYKVWEMILERDGVAYPDYEGTICAESFYGHGELSGTVTCYDPDEITDGNPRAHKDLWFSANLIGKITLSGKPTKWVAVSADRGIFAYRDISSEANPVTHWYVKKSGYQYKGAEPEISTFEKIAQMIENDTDATYGGQTVANQFRNGGNVSGSVNCYDPAVTDNPAQHPEYVFSADIVGQIGTVGNRSYIGVSGEYGIFAYKYSAVSTPASYPRVVHWYQQSAGSSFNNKQPVITDSNGDFYTTDDGSPDGNKTVLFKPTELTGYGSQGEAVLGYDLTSPTPKWRIGLNLPVQYEDIDGVTRTADGFVTADDFNIENIPSFKTKLAVVDVLIAGKVDATEIEADIAYVRKINSQYITANTYISSANGGFNYVSSGGFAAVRRDEINYGFVEAYDFIFKGASPDPLHPTTTRKLQKCFYSCSASESDGVITLTFTTADGTTETTNFNMAATQFYIDAIAAAYDDGVSDYYNSSYWARPSSSNSWRAMIPNSGNSASIKWFAINELTGSNLSAENIKKNVNVFGVTGTYEGSGGGSIATDDIQIDSYGNLNTGTIARTMKAGILQAIDNRTYFSWRTYIKGPNNTIRAEKYYYMDFSS